MTIYTIGFTGKTAEEFFETLRINKIRRVLDVRLNNTSQLAAFSKKADLEYFLKVILDADYYHIPLLAPSKETREMFKKEKDWDHYVREYNRELDERYLSKNLDMTLFDRDVVLLCSEAKAEKCHRGLAANRIKELAGAGKILHL